MSSSWIRWASFSISSIRTINTSSCLW